MVEIINGNVDPEVRDKVLSVTQSFWKALADRDSEKRFSFCADYVTFIGTGLNEKASDKKEYWQINKKGIEQYPQQFLIDFLWIRLSVVGDMAWVENEVEWTMPMKDTVSKELIRNTVLLKKIDEEWLIVHVHGSIPDYRLAEQNYITSEETLKMNRELEGQVYQRTRDLNESLKELKAAQAQLIQSEKMASLGELTAGIAHEIQNPLNFVNNFSEVNTELIDEMQEELDKGNLEHAKALAKDIKANEQKINHHGKRADSIVKGMLQHSRNRSGQKELTDINALADECMRLSYHGMRAKDKSFNAKTETDLDNSIPKINIVSQDIGRVILNLFTNAFYSVMQKKKHASTSSAGDVFEPVVTVKTANTEAGVTISIRDNGNGVPQKVIEKIFQPFFTTKPVGEGTGLGLSMSYDIITKGHGGQLKVETKEGEYAQFTIILPVKS